MTNELTDVRCPCGDEFPADSYDAGFIAGSGMCQNCDAALPPKDICTCPSGNGSLRHPCPAHPASVEQAGGDERAAFRPAQVISYRPGMGEVTIYVAGRVPGYMNIGDTVYVSDRAPVEQPSAALAQPSPVLPPFAEKVLAKLRRFYDCASDFESGGVDIGRHWLDLLTQLGLLNRVQRSPALWEITQQGEDLLGTPQPSPAQADEKPGDSILCYGCFAKGVGPEHFDEAGKCLVRQQLDPLNLAQHAEEFNEAPAEALKPEQAEAERPEVVAYFDRNYPSTGDAFIWSNYEGSPYEPVMTVAQHERIVGALRAVITQLHQHKNDYMDAGQETYRALQNEIREREAEIARLDGLVSVRTAERDAALARVAELEKQEPVVRAYGVLPPFAEKVLAKLRRFYDCAEDFESGGVDIGRHWLDLLTQLGLLNRVQRSPALWEISQHGEDLLEAPVAQAQHSGPEEFSFEYRHPNGESHTVTVSRDQVINEMPDFLFEALCSKFCNCEPAGETNVVECCCDEYAEEFKLLAAAPVCRLSRSALTDAQMRRLYDSSTETENERL
ncbi:hypothetical protein [Pseudomonas aeruginosa]|uniref:hypothetical protein n=1 Tax=Pseudomonas aeruginosa TaxID=287 RepID=UPI000ABE7682|nr:hypothetical protein [Pseudomonas aeruginosa]HCF6977200.1 hypothetical protein [Pseudomonas aeruginosa]